MQIQADQRPPFVDIDRRIDAMTSVNVQPLSSITTKFQQPQGVDRSVEMIYDTFPRHIADALREVKGTVVLVLVIVIVVNVTVGGKGAVISVSQWYH